MGSRYLTDLADVCRRIGRPVIEVGSSPSTTGDAWKKRARGSGGYDSGRPNHIIVHHTASSPSASGWQDANYCTFSNSNKPVCNLLLSRQGEIFVCAAGATNTNGSGHDPCGTTPDDSMNSHAIGIEASNNGVGEVWPTVQQDAYVALVRELCNHYGIPNGRIHSHFEWAPDRKIDPAGQSRYASGGNKWNMAQFRSDCAGAAPPDPGPDPVPPSGDDWWTPLMNSLPTLGPNSTGPAVKRMQHLLAAAGFMNPANTANYDGVQGMGTCAALSDFKASVGGARDNICDPWTWGALMHTVDGIPELKKGAKGDDVERMQHLLAAAGFMNEANTANYDGAWGDGTDGAKQRFDVAKGLTPSPPTDCGKKSWTKLLQG